MTDLAAFLRARLDEEETAARKVDKNRDAFLALRNRLPREASRTWNLIYDPARVLAEVEVKRRIIVACSGDEPGTTYYLDNPAVVDGLNYRVLHLLARPYADHPDYNPEWRT